jgi:zinc transporter ZupT
MVVMLRNWLWALVPVGLTVLMIAVFVNYRPLDFITGDVPPAEEITVERVVLNAQGIHVTVRAEGPVPIRIAQVQVDGAWRVFTISPNRPVGHLSSAWISIPYPWVAGEAHNLVFLSSTGAAFEHTIDVAAASPKRDWNQIWGLALIGLFIGLVPVTLGLLFTPVMRTFSDKAMNFILALTVGLLAYLLVDTIREGLEVAEKAAGGFRADVLLWAGMAGALLLLFGISRGQGRVPEGLALAAFIALGIGLHNLGEGLVVGAAIATAQVSLATFLILGFALHNLTEGIAIAAPVARKQASLLSFFGLACLAGLPAIAGTIVGAFAFSPHWAALAFGVGAGAIAQVIIEITAYFLRTAKQAKQVPFQPATWSGLTAGVGIMYITAFFVSG